ncbi:MAG: thiamine-phosphate kinase [Myxococcales bacterium]|nr:thiamine-phosphate kinase [Myxococcales bacterium]
MSGEFERIAEIRRRLGVVDGGLLVGNGDDAAVLAPDRAPVVVSVDTVVEGVHFRRELLSPADIGYRAMCGALSDLAAMGAAPRAVVMALVAPRQLDDATLYAIADGVAEAQHDMGAPVVGGNLAAGSELSISTTVIGRGAERSLTRGGAQAGDGLFATGDLGASGLGLRALLEGKPELAPRAVARWRRPRPRLEQGQALVGVASSCIDISDGLLSDLAHLQEATGLGFEVELAALPLPPEATVAAALGTDPQALALSGGEDYELLFTAPLTAQLPIEATRLGRVVTEPGLRLRDADGATVPPPARAGFDHFD